jgi:hypothetical protein
MSNLPADESPAVGPLDYASAAPRMVRIARYSNAYEAQMHAAALRAEGIPTEIFGLNSNAVNPFWQGFAKVELHVPATEADRAAQVITDASSIELEPAPMEEHADPPVDEDGNALITVSAYDSVNALRDAQTILASARIPAFIPPLIPRGDRPAGAGKRFVLRVAEDDLDRADAVLADESEDNSEDPRCPACGSWRVYEHTTLLGALSTLFGRRRGPQCECLACHHRGSKSEFLA